MSIYEVLNSIIETRLVNLSDSVFSNNHKELIDDDNEIRLFMLLKNISGLTMEIRDSQVLFHPIAQFQNGDRTFSPEDITEFDYSNLLAMDFYQIPLILRARVCDIIWIIRNDFKKFSSKAVFDCSQIAAAAYWDLFLTNNQADSSIFCVNYYKRALSLSKSTNGVLSPIIIEWSKEYLLSYPQNNNINLTLVIFSSLEESELTQNGQYLAILDKIIQNYNTDNYVFEKAYMLKIKLYKYLGDRQTIKQTNIDLANHISHVANHIMRTKNQTMMATELLSEAVNLHRNNGNHADVPIARRQLEAFQSQMKIPIVFSSRVINADEYSSIREYLAGLTFEESIYSLADSVIWHSRNEVESKVLKNLSENPLLGLIEKNIVNEVGNTILKLPPLDKNQDEYQKTLDLHIYHNQFYYHRLSGIYLSSILDIIRENYKIETAMLEFIVKNNPIIPDGRERIFQVGLTMLLRGEFYEAMHILAPQMENLFRNIAREAGDFTTALDESGTTKEKVLSSIFELPELLNIYNNDILFNFRGLLAEVSGSNIRNIIAHGIVDEESCSYGEYIFLGCSIIKLLSLRYSCWQ